MHLLEQCLAMITSTCAAFETDPAQPALCGEIADHIKQNSHPQVCAKLAEVRCICCIYVIFNFKQFLINTLNRAVAPCFLPLFISFVILAAVRASCVFLYDP